MQKEQNLSALPNIGKVLSERLNLVDIKTSEELAAIGSENAFIRLLTVDENSCINELFALEGAIQGIRWHNLSDSTKEELRIVFHLCKNQNRKK